MSSGSPVPVIMLHGIGGSARVWNPQSESFRARGFAPHPLDTPGYGARPPVTSMTFDELADDVERTIADRGLDRPVLLGHSMGGMTVQTLLRRNPHAYRAAVLCCTSPAFGRPDGDFQRQFVAARLAPLDKGLTMADMAEESFSKMTGPLGATTPHRALAIGTLANTPASTYRAAVHCLVAFDERANLGSIAVPTLCLAGEIDANAPSPMMERMAAKIRSAQYVCLPGVGHLPNIEAPAAFDTAVLDFLENLPAH